MWIRWIQIRIRIRNTALSCIEPLKPILLRFPTPAPAFCKKNAGFDSMERIVSSRHYGADPDPRIRTAD
jgi:hypothetical protein